MRLFIGFSLILVIVVEIISSAELVAGNSRGRKQFDPEEDGFFDDFGFKKGQYNFGEKILDFADIKSYNVPYPVHLEIPKTTFSCIGRNQGYYADEEAGCQAFHVCDADQVSSSFLCPVGSLFSQRLLTCDWWNKVPCSQSHDNLNEIPFTKNRKVHKDQQPIIDAAQEIIGLIKAHNKPDESVHRMIKTQNIHNLSGFKLNQYQNYHTHYLPDTFLKYQNNQRSTANHFKNFEYNQNAHRINFELQQGKPIDFLWTMSQAIIANTETLPRPFTNKNDENESTPTLETFSHLEFIPSLSFDFSNDQEKRKYYANFQQNVSKSV